MYKKQKNPRIAIDCKLIWVIRPEEIGFEQSPFSSKLHI